SLFVADFIGDSTILDGHFDSSGGLRRAGGSVIAARLGEAMSDGTGCSLIVRPERIAVQAEGSATGAGRVAVNAVVSDIVYFGEYRKVYLATDDGGSAVAKENAGDWSDT